MKRATSQQLTSHEFVNKLILSKAKYNDSFDVIYQKNNKAYHKRKTFLQVVQYLHEENELSTQECQLIFENLCDVRPIINFLLDYEKECLAKMNCCVNELKNDRLVKVRVILAKNGHFLDEYVHDARSEVRAEVAKCGYGLDILSQDESQVVRLAVELAHIRKRIEELTYEGYRSLPINTYSEFE